jgi:hypothetical protein
MRIVLVGKLTEIGAVNHLQNQPDLLICPQLLASEQIDQDPRTPGD